MRLGSACLCGAVVVALPVAGLQSQDTTRSRPPQQLEAVTIRDSADFISTRLAGFERRRLIKAGTVTFLMGEDIVKRGTIRLSDALRRAPGVRIVDSADVRLVASSRWQKPVGGGFLAPQRRPLGINNRQGTSDADLAPCIMQVALDGVLKEWGFSVDDISVTEVHGIEVYPGAASLPAEFGSIRRDGWCGLVMIWTRAR